ncbi:hypothetical protein L7F22_001415 [Adiantum nelumboides]|nr:hypothetical protein [Adiantum nelumboides]
MAIAEDSDSSQDEDFQLPTHAGQLCMLRKLTHPAKRQKKSQCLSKKGKQKLRPISIEGKENQDQGNCRNGCSHPKCKFADPDLLQVRRPLAPRMLNDENRTLPSVAENSKGELVSGQNDKGEIVLNEASTHSNRSPNVLLDQPSETDCTSACPYLTHYYQKVAGRAPEALLSSAPKSRHAYHNQAITIAHSSAVGAKGNSPAKQTANDYHNDHAYKAPEKVMLETLKSGGRTFQKMKESFELQSQMAGILSPRPSSPIEGNIHQLAQNNGDLLVGTVEGNSTNTSMDAVISLAEEENLVIDLTEQKQQQFEPDFVPQGTLDAADCLSQGNVNLDSQFNALLDLCVNSLSDNNEVDELHVDTIGDSLAAKDGSLLVEELISSLMTQNRRRESSVSCDVDLGTIEGFPKDIQNSHTESAVTALLIGSQQTCLEAQKLSSGFEDVSDCKQADSDEKLIDEGTGAYIESNFEQPLECPVCGRCITGLSLEQREVHTNECLDNIDRKDTYTDARNPLTGIDQVSCGSLLLF